LILNLKQRVQLESGQLGSYWLELRTLTLAAFIALHALRWMETPLYFSLSELATLSKLLAYCVLRSTQPPTLSGTVTGSE